LLEEIIEMNNKKKITRLEVETGLAKLLFYTKISAYYKPYLPYRDIFEKILSILENMELIYMKE